MAVREGTPRPVVGITAGDPSSIGPEVVIKAMMNPDVRECSRVLILGDARVFDRIRKMLKAGISWKTITSYDGPGDLDAGGMPTLLDFANAPDPETFERKPDATCGRASVEYVERAIDLAMEGKIDAIATAPINKESILLAGSKFPGHTEMLAERTGTEKKVMMLAGGPLRVALVTIHISLAHVPKALSINKIYDTIRITHDSLTGLFGIEKPKLAVCGLNPHAGESGRFGDEEQRLIEPAIKKAQAEGINCSGPHPPDTVFYYAAKGAYDAVVCMYHDQGLIPLKLLAFESAVNITLGLPIIRTSVDHGTAFDIAGRGVASPDSMIEAIKLAAHFAGQR